MAKNKKPFEPKEIDLTQEGRIAFVPSEIEQGDFDKKWWPLLEGFPFNIMYSSAHQDQNMRLAMTAALYEPDLATFREAETERELTYFNKQGGDYRVRVILKKAGGMETFKYRGEELIAFATGHEFDRAMAQTIMIGIQRHEPVTITYI